MHSSKHAFASPNHTETRDSGTDPKEHRCCGVRLPVVILVGTVLVGVILELAAALLGASSLVLLILVALVLAVCAGVMVVAFPKYAAAVAVSATFLIAAITVASMLLVQNG